MKCWRAPFAGSFAGHLPWLPDMTPWVTQGPSEPSSLSLGGVIFPMILTPLVAEGSGVHTNTRAPSRSPGRHAWLPGLVLHLHLAGFQSLKALEMKWNSKNIQVTPKKAYTGEQEGETGSLVHYWWECKMGVKTCLCRRASLENTRQFLTKLNMHLSRDPAVILRHSPLRY